MRPSQSVLSIILAGLLFAGAAVTIAAAEQSVCITCHLDEAMLVKNLGKVEVKTSSMQTGSG